jgi:hypothetical protein
MATAPPGIRPQTDTNGDAIPGPALAAVGFVVGLLLAALDWLPVAVFLSAGIGGVILLGALSLRTAKRRSRGPPSEDAW